MPNDPKVSVLLPVRNGAAHLGAAIESVLGQTLADFELLILDDGSSDGSVDIAESYRDSRIKLSRLPGEGLVTALNRGAALACAPLIARMDADDLCRPHRLALQAKHFEEAPALGVLGGQVHFFGNNPKQYRYPLSHEAIKAAAVFDCPLIHPTVMFRSGLLEPGLPLYDPAQRHAEDYGLWTRWLLSGVRFGALEDIVLDYRIHPGQVTTLHRGVQRQVGDLVRRTWLAKLGLEATPAEIQLHGDAAQGAWGLGLDYLVALEAWLLKLLFAVRRSPVLDPVAFEAVLAQRWTSALWANRGLGNPLRQLASKSLLSELPHPQPWKPWLAWIGSAFPSKGVVK